MKSLNSSAAGEVLTLVGVFAIVIVIVMVITGCFFTVPAGNVGVTDTFGVVGDTVSQPGLHLKFPWTGVTSLSGQTQKYMDYGSTDTSTITALSNEGLSVSMAIAVNYHLDTTKATEVYKRVGPAYQNIVMVNPIHAVPRDIISKYDVKTLYSASQPGSADRAKIENELYEGIQSGINKGGVKDSIVIEQVFIREIKLPQTLMDSIASKLSMEQQIAQKQFEVQKQEAESNRMRAEARGIADANKIIANSLTQSYLEWYSIEMMKSHPGATYFIPISSNGRYTPEPVLPVDGSMSGNSNMILPANLINNMSFTK
jgi:prohibitin 1